MKRASIDSRKSAIVNGDSKAEAKFQNLVRDFLEVQKEFVSKKRKLQVLKQRKEILEDEVGFLRRRCRYLQKLQNRNRDLENLSMVLESKQNLGAEEEEALMTKEKPQNKGLVCLKSGCFCKFVHQLNFPE